MALRRERVQYDGQHWTLPLPDGPGKAIKLTVHPVREQIPIYLAAVGPKNLELTGRIADGWLAIFFSPEHAAISLDPLRAGRQQAGHIGDDALKGFDVVPTVPVMIDDDIDTAAAPIRAYAALYVGGMGSREQNFYNALACRMGFETEAAQVQDLYLNRQYQDAANAVPRDFIDATSLIGPVERIRDRMQAFAAAGVTTLSVSPFATTLEGRVQTLRRAAEALEAAGLAE
jgi:alkanesulfonate monooxygenase SsuD/methylene tetrahydromethanopterin reductase-like flavin-dependent oxidoreductase (luciferase family)